MDKQLQFVSWLKRQGIYDSYKSAALMRFGQMIWEKSYKPRWFEEARICSPNNPLGLLIGDRVEYTHLVDLDYHEPGVKSLKFKEWKGSGVISGVVTKCEGKVKRFHEPDGLGLSVVREWKATKRHQLYEVKTHTNGKARLVHPDHIVKETFRK